jgi:uncharacterized protein
MRSDYHDHVLNVSDLIDRPGSSRQVDFAVPTPDEFDLPLVEVRGPVRLSGVVESVVDGLLVRAALVADLALQCARCLEPVEDSARTDVVELFVDPLRVPLDADPPDPGYEIVDGRIDVDALLRDALVPATPFQPLCRPDCAGLCASCGADLNAGPCGCRDVAVDTRWAPLAGLDLPSGEERG